MNESRKLKAYSFIEGIESRAKLLEKGITGAQKVDPNTAQRLTQRNSQPKYKSKRVGGYFVMKFRTFLLGLSALFVAFNAAFFSVSGLSKLFAGASLSVMLMASSLELAKLITAGYLYNYWEKINRVFRWYLVSGVLILVLITSLGIYGFLHAAFQDTFNMFSVNEKQKTFLQQKEKFYADDVARYDEELERISNNISTLSNAKSQQIQVRDTSVVGGVRTTISTELSYVCTK